MEYLVELLKYIMTTLTEELVLEPQILYKTFTFLEMF